MAAAVGLSLVACVTFGSVVGAGLPLLIKRLGFDPAVSSGPFIASLVDVLGIMIYMKIAIAILGRLNRARGSQAQWLRCACLPLALGAGVSCESLRGRAADDEPPTARILPRPPSLFRPLPPPLSLLSLSSSWSSESRLLGFSATGCALGVLTRRSGRLLDVHGGQRAAGGDADALRPLRLLHRGLVLVFRVFLARRFLHRSDLFSIELFIIRADDALFPLELAAHGVRNLAILLAIFAPLGPGRPGQR